MPHLTVSSVKQQFGRVAPCLLCQLCPDAVATATAHMHSMITLIEGMQSRGTPANSRCRWSWRAVPLWRLSQICN